MIQSRHRFCLLLRRQICLNPVLLGGLQSPTSLALSLRRNLATPRWTKPTGLIEPWSAMEDHQHRSALWYFRMAYCVINENPCRWSFNRYFFVIRLIDVDLCLYTLWLPTHRKRSICTSKGWPTAKSRNSSLSPLFSKSIRRRMRLHCNINSFSKLSTRSTYIKGQCNPKMKLVSNERALVGE